ncbi:hypothetical protein [Microvirga sp. 2TAF3]|uniref:hypothetical protein n=1 Tax=Microvirga sp. 2TAF3 TaxID=3233014 RepID=UPI003F9EB765
MRKFLFGLFGVVALGFGAFAAQPASAQPYYPGYHERPGYRPIEYRGPYRGPRYHGYRPHGYRPAYVAPRCFVRPQRVWNGYRWVQRPVRICR